MLFYLPRVVWLKLEVIIRNLEMIIIDYRYIKQQKYLATPWSDKHTSPFAIKLIKVLVIFLKLKLSVN